MLHHINLCEREDRTIIDGGYNKIGSGRNEEENFSYSYFLNSILKTVLHLYFISS